MRNLYFWHQIILSDQVLSFRNIAISFANNCLGHPVRICVLVFEHQIFGPVEFKEFVIAFDEAKEVAIFLQLRPSLELSRMRPGQRLHHTVYTIPLMFESGSKALYIPCLC